MTIRRSMHGTTAVARAAAVLLVSLLALPAPAPAEPQTFDSALAPIVRVNIRSGDVTIRTWDRESVVVEADPSLLVLRRTMRAASLVQSIPIPAVQQPSPEGPVELPPESFVVGDVPPGLRDTIVVRDPQLGLGAAGPPTPVTITVPADSVFVFARTNSGTLDVHDYHGGTFLGFVGSGRMQLDNVGGTVFAQTGRAPMVVTNSSFDRLRARSLFGNMTFEHCSARQIEATSVDGSIVYDDGAFAPGLAHFESTRGDVAIGATGPVQLGGHAAGAGRVFTNFVRPAEIDGRGAEANAVFDGGGPVVTATSASGNVFFYDGTLRTRQQLSSQWQAPIGALQRPATPLRREFAPPVTTVPATFRQRFPVQHAPAPQFRRPQPVRVTPTPTSVWRRFRGFRAFPRTRQ
jgi:hypothetical protein